MQCNLSIAVGNSVSEVKQWASSLQQSHEQQKQGLGDASTVSKHLQHQQVYLAKQPVAAGVLEGLAAFGFLSNQAMN